MEQVKKIFIKKPKDERGVSAKVYNEIILKNYEISFKVDEIYTSFSKENVLRGMHFQIMPFAQKKIISVLKGSILDVIIDIRADALTLGEVHEFYIDEDSEYSLYIPKGFAHGFKTMGKENIILYAMEGNQTREAERGFAWNSFGYDWNINMPIISKVDQNLPAFDKVMDKLVNSYN